MLPLHPQVLVHHDALVGRRGDAGRPLVRVGVGLGPRGKDHQVGGVGLTALGGVGAPADEVPGGTAARMGGRTTETRRLPRSGTWWLSGKIANTSRRGWDPPTCWILHGGDAHQSWNY